MNGFTLIETLVYIALLTSILCISCISLSTFQDFSQHIDTTITSEVHRNLEMMYAD